LTRQLAAQFGQEEVTGLVITSVERYGSAARAGVRAGQIVRSINGRATRSLSDFGEATESIEDGDAVSLRVLDPEIGETILNFRLRGR
jgi:S1-C subfamily serine protease